MKLTFALVGAMILAGCGGDKASSTGSAPGSSSASGGKTVLSSSAPAPTKVDRAATVAKEIQADPEHSEEVLRRHGMTEDQFEDLLYEIAADPAMSKEYGQRMGP